MNDYLEELKKRNEILKEMIRSSKEELEEHKKKEEERQKNKLRGYSVGSIICDEPIKINTSFQTILNETLFPIEINFKDESVEITEEHIKFFIEQYQKTKKESIWKRIWKNILKTLKIA